MAQSKLSGGETNLGGVKREAPSAGRVEWALFAACSRVRLLRTTAAVALGASLLMGSTAVARNVATEPPVQVAAQPTGTVALGELRAEAVRAIRSGDFDKGTALLQQAANTGGDGQLTRLAGWAQEYESQRQVLVGERREKFNKAVEDVRKLVEANIDEVAIDYAVRAYVLAEKKDEFAATDLVRGLIARSSAKAEEFEDREQWIKAVRLYADITNLEPNEHKWKEKLKSMTRRIRLLALYAPDRLKALRDEDIKHIEAMEVEKVIPPTGPKAATRPSADAGESPIKQDWRDNLRNIKPEMFFPALVDVRSNYWKSIDFVKMMRGGFEGVRAALQTGGLETTFPALADPAKRQAMLTRIDELEKQIAAAPASMEVLEGSKVYWRLLEANRQILGIPDEVLVYEFADGALAECDPFTSMIWPADVEEFNKSTQGEFPGVGIQISSDDDGAIKVVTPIEDSPAFRKGVKAGDIITHVNGKPIKGITTTQAVRIITGPPGTSVTLTVRSFDGTTRDLELTRETIKVGSLKGFLHKPGGGWDYMIDPENRIAYLRLTNFTKTSAEELARAAADLKAQGARGIILDLRYNPGGLLSAAIDISNRFLSSGVIVSTRADRQTPYPPTIATARPEADDINTSMVVLVNQYSASASEIVSGALKDLGRAVVVGERSYGKGSVQVLMPTDDRAAYLKLTTAHYYLPSGRCLHREETSKDWGVDPDVRVEMTPQQMDAAYRARIDLDVLRNSGDAAPAPSTQPASEGGRVVARTPEDLLKSDSQLGAALLLLRLQLNGVEVAEGTRAPGVGGPIAR